MGDIGIALDLGTSGFRGQAVELPADGSEGRVIATAITARHPLPGANVMDHLHFAIQMGLELSQRVVIHTVNQVIEQLDVPREAITRLAICGNPIQLSLFEGIEIRDLAYAGKTRQETLGYEPPKREAKALPARDIPNLDIPSEAKVYIPPAVRHEIGADALAMMIKADILERDEIALVTDYGTNAEMALKIGQEIFIGDILTGSAAAGPALEGQTIAGGMLAAPGAISDVVYEGDAFRLYILNDEMKNRPGNLVDLATGEVLEEGELKAKGITGTGTIALVHEAMKAGLIRLPEILTPDRTLHLGGKLVFSETDLAEAGKAIGAVRAGHITLASEAGIHPDDIGAAYMAGASGTYVDALKVHWLGMTPSSVANVYQIGNTSLALAQDVVREPQRIWELEEIAQSLRAAHCMFAESETFKKVYVLELSYWTEGMPWEMYQQFLKTYGLPQLDVNQHQPQVTKMVERDIADFGYRGLQVVSEIGSILNVCFDGCTGCRVCVYECPEDALRLVNRGPRGDRWFDIEIQSADCLGLGCLRCQTTCPENVFHWTESLAAWSSLDQAAFPDPSEGEEVVYKE
ncbi:MAG: methylamine methyltransferase corrinoid protein reductive activase [Rhodobacteraceae bacterium]|nr:methylamine methyltransferase corrinoid protein reductive activase [Paracoccaceae bacterium]